MSQTDVQVEHKASNQSAGLRTGIQKNIHTVQGEKGGVGKSVIALALIHIYAARKEPVIVIETDRSNGDVGRACEGKEGYIVVTPYLSENPDEIGKADEVIEAVLAHGMNAVMNSPAQSHRATLQWLKQGSADLAIEEGIQFQIWFVTSGEYDSVALFLQSLADFPFPHVLVRNGHFIKRITYDYSDPSRNKTLKAAIERHHVPVVEFPPLIPSDIDVIRSHALTFHEALTSNLLKIAERSRIRRAIQTFSEQIAEELLHESLAPAPNGDHVEGSESRTSRKGSRRQNRQAKADGMGDSEPNGDCS